MGEQVSEKGNGAAISKRNELVVAVREYQDSQRELVLAQSRASALSLMLGLSNRAENARLAKEQTLINTRLDLGEEAILNIQEQVDDQEKVIQCVDSKVSDQTATIEHLEKKVKSHKKHLDSLAAEYQKEMQEQRSLIDKHRKEFGMLILSKLKQDATLDTVILLFAYVFAKSPLVNWPVQMFSSVTGIIPLLPMKRENRSIAVSQLSRVFVVLFIARAMRIVAARHGLHNSVGGPEVYAAQIVELLKLRLKLILPSKQDVKEENTEQPSN
uniref:Uncharacterized protein n=1 Tax=Mucochytrium quahogii TaxID=96639 RepID=A0A7S2WKE1_9STRA|mmetsp:Transcript_12681/g.20508  ORF Transcript_12681/g.20508 Transcript_12681/m.20508 type:complete len:271 (-) Transcript_12681:474-1286(-)|eukprot:CAMPEP_0203768278 /NCGR_PEP_ID=MMETSP0099_2-20121227/1489_1 /ASSEMBLY_ACC=CAM_ASM_000209 /TAXON_ID=96639 /ORGANISM=" , Strain NY0313808BC1" /LENGTH=270 /DNA_ID=CAMNT_0050664931 /DNA_START=166 /DNA_END=978 /DNA_ORIENTATION=+